MRALIAAGGRSTRMRPITYTINKHLIPLANQPMLSYAIAKLADAGITEMVINVNPGEIETMQKTFGNGERWNVHLTYVEQQGGAKGIAHAVANAESYLRGDSFVFFLGDNIMLGDLRRMRERFESEKLNCLVALSRVKDPRRFGVPEFHPDGTIRRAVEKPENPPSPFAITGIYFFSDQYFDAFPSMKPSARGEYEITDMITWFIEHGKVGHEEITGWWKDTGKPEDLLEGNALLLSEMKLEEAINEGACDPTAVIQGRVKIGKGTTIGRNTLIRGPVAIGSNVKIENAFIGPNTSIGDHVTVEQAEVEHSIIMEGSSIKTSARIVDAIVGRNAVVASCDTTKPHGHRLIIGDNAVVEL